MGLNGSNSEIVKWLKAILASLQGSGGSSLPPGAATSANQTTEIAHLATIAGEVRAEDTAHVSGHTGTMALAVRNDAGAALADTTGDYIPLTTDNVGALRVAIISGAGSGGTALADEAAFVEGTTSFTPVGGVLNDTIVSDPTEDQAAAFRITAKRAIHANLRNVAGTEIGTAAAPVRVDPTGTTAQPVTDNAGSLTIDNATLSVVGSGTEATALRVTLATDSTGLVSVDDNGGSLTVDGTVTIQDGGNVISVDDAGASLTVDNPTLSVVGGGPEATALRVTIANDSTGVLSVDDNGGSLTVDGSVALTSVVPGTGATNLGKAEDALHTSGDVGVMMLAVRNDAGTALATTNGDYIPLSTNVNGHLFVASLAEGATATTTTWTSATALNAAVLFTVSQYQGLAVTIAITSAISAGGVTFEVGDALGQFFSIQAVRTDTLVAEKTSSLILAAGIALQAWQIDVRGFSTFRVRLSTAIVGAGSAVVQIAGSSMTTTLRTITNQQRSATSAITSVAASATNVTLLAANALRLGGSVYNDSTVVLTLKLGATASATSKTLDIYASGYYPIPDGYTGILDGLWASATGSARITELTV